MIVIKRGDEPGDDLRPQIAEILVRGFCEDFERLAPSPGRLAEAFGHMLILDRFFVALDEDRPAAIASLTSGEQECFAPRWPEFRRHLGRVRGSIAYAVVRSQFLGVPEEARQGLAEIGFVTTSPAHQGRGVATALLRRLLELPGYDEFILREIKDTNAPALGLYRKLGFTEYRRRAIRYAGRAGFSEYVSMRRAGERPAS